MVGGRYFIHRFFPSFISLLLMFVGDIARDGFKDVVFKAKVMGLWG